MSEKKKAVKARRRAYRRGASPELQANTRASAAVRARGTCTFCTHRLHTGRWCGVTAGKDDSMRNCDCRGQVSHSPPPAPLKRCARSGLELAVVGRSRCEQCAPLQFVHPCSVDGEPIEISDVMRQAQATPPLRWTQFETETLLQLREARLCLVKVSGFALADGMTTWSGEAHELAARVQKLVESIEENQKRALQEMCR